MSVFRRRRKDGAASEPEQPEVGSAPPGTAAPPSGPPTAGAGEQTGAGGVRPPAGAAEEPAAPKSPRPQGPWDADEEAAVALDQRGRVDLGALRVRPREGMALQLQVDERSGQASSVLVVAGDAAVQMLVVAAPRSTGWWPEARAQIAADATRRGGTVESGNGPLGEELRMLVPVQVPDGTTGVQPSRVVGIDGPRWMLRVSFLGRATTDPEAFERLAAVVRDTVVFRGQDPVAPGDLLALTVPETAVRQPPPHASPQSPPPVSAQPPAEAPGEG